MAFLPRALKVHESRPPTKKPKRTGLGPQSEAVSCHEESTEDYALRSESTSVEHARILSTGTGGPDPPPDITESASGRATPSAHLGSPVDEYSNADGDSDDELVVSYSKDQRWPLPGEPVCVVCRRYGAYISDATEDDVCSLECKARALHLKGLPLPAAVQQQQQEEHSGRGEGSTGSVERATSQPVECNYREHPDVASLNVEQVEALRNEVMELL